MLLPALIVMFVIAVIFSAFGTAIACVLEDMQGFQLIMNFIVMPTFFFSGALFPLGGLPTALEIVAKADPLTYGVDALRGILIGANHFHVAWSVSILAAIMAVLLAASSYLFSRMEI